MSIITTCAPFLLACHHRQQRKYHAANPFLQTHKAPFRLNLQPSNDSSFGLRVQAARSGGGEADVKQELRTCRNCKKTFNPLENHPRACRFHTAHFGGETKRKFESVYTGGTMETVGGGEISQYWHCCGAADAFDPGCEAAPHMSYDD